MPNLQDVVRLFHAECGGAVVGDLEGPWTCSECGAEMRRMVSDFDVVELRPEVSEEVSAYLSKLGKKGGKIGGTVTANQLTPAQRKKKASAAGKASASALSAEGREKRARAAAEARWGKKKTEK